MKLRAALLAATILAVPLAAQAEAVNGLYIGAGAGANWLNDTRLRSADIGGVNINLGKTRQQFDVGVRALASVGYGFGNGLRVELEGDYFQNSLSRVGRFTSGGGIGGSNFQPLATTVSGDRLKYGGFANVLYDFDPNILFGLGNAIPFPVSPYIGAGAGYLQAKNSNVLLQSGNQALIRSTGTDGNFAYQAIIGAAFPISAAPGLAVTAEYRFTGLADNTNFRGQYFAPGVATRAQLRESDQYNHSAMLGLRYAFNAAPPPPPPAVPVPVAAAESRTYLVFFDWDRADLTSRARQIIAEAAQATQRVQTTRIEVSGYTDSSGTAQYNQGLSVRRAQNVSAELVRLGVPRQAITVQGFGETRQLVQTASGVREPQNRRVEIVLR